MPLGYELAVGLDQDHLDGRVEQAEAAQEEEDA